jgi:hypothetical protein
MMRTPSFFDQHMTLMGRRNARKPLSPPQKRIQVWSGLPDLYLIQGEGPPRKGVAQKKQLKPNRVSRTFLRRGANPPVNQHALATTNSHGRL